MNNIKDFLPFLIPYIIIELGLLVVALIHVIKHPHYKFGNKLLWVLLVVLLQIIGPVLYFVFGRGEDESF